MAGADHIELGQERSLRAILGAAARLYAKYPLLFLILAVGVIGPWDIAVLAASGHGPLYHGRKNAGESLFAILAQLALIGPLVSALHVHAVQAIGDGSRPRLSTVALQGLRVLPVVAAAAIVSGLASSPVFSC